MKKISSFISLIIAWSLSLFMLLSYLVYFPSLSSFLMLAFSIILMPISKIQSVLSAKGVKGTVKFISLTVLFFLSIFLLPSQDFKSSILMAAIALLFSLAGIFLIFHSKSHVSKFKSSSKHHSASMFANNLVASDSGSNLPVDTYIVLDIETTGLSRKNDRIIEIAANKYSGGKLVKRYHTYVNPQLHIPARITQLTGISDADVANAPPINSVKSKFLSFIGSTPLVGHNISTFDIPFLREQLSATIDNKQFDTLRIAKTSFPNLPSYKLTYLDELFHLGGNEHHRATNDVDVANSLFIACFNKKDYLKYLSDNDRIDSIQIEESPYLFQNVDIHSIVKTNPSNDAVTSLSGKTICFTGELSIPRAQAMQLAVDAGAILKSCVSKKLDYLVVGEQDKRLVGETGMSNSQHYASSLIASGHKRLNVINEEKFFELLQETV